MDGWLPLHLRCIVVKATQILQSCLVAELVFILVGDREDGDPVSFITAKNSRRVMGSIPSSSYLRLLILELLIK